MNPNNLTHFTRISGRTFGGPQIPRFLSALTLLLFLSLAAQAQFPGGFGGFPGAGGNNASRSRTSGNYPNNSVGDATFHVDPDTRSLVVVADPDTTKYISEVLSNLDRPKPQVLIKVVFLEVTRNDASDIGIEGTYNNNNIGGGFLNGLFTTNFTVFNPGGSNAAVVPSSVTPLTGSSAANVAHLFGPGAAAGSTLPATAGLYQILGQDYSVTLHAIAQAGKAKVLSRPSVVTRNNQPATILVGQTVPLITSVRYDTFGNAINGITYTDVGIILRVTPFITKEGTVEMILSPEISSVSKTDSTPLGTGSNSVNAPFIDKRSADTVVVTPDGQTVIIGGMIQTQKAESENKIPYLGDIPILGNLFKRKFTSDVNTELLIFLTPHIIQAPTEMAAMTDTESSKSGMSKAFSEQELNKFLDSLPKMQKDDPKSRKKKKSAETNPSP